MKENELFVLIMIQICTILSNKYFLELFLTIFLNSLIIYSSHYNYNMIFVE